MKPTSGGKGTVKFTVAEDNILRDRIIKELKSEDTWNNDWGFLITKDNPDVVLRADDKIKMLEKTIQEQSKVKMSSTYQNNFAPSNSLEIFFDKNYNKRKNKDLKPADRKPKKEVRPDYSK
eukprot:TRINITY_DN634_c0_g2_i1.p1 TRINITY_DN634_c0_g2~~TRINITY_DN634_c0_g2_i1.p1  ORF type:complete len:121 (+),score=45.24 TRINITY_DN634_c0_g2_i1:131-493(+)